MKRTSPEGEVPLLRGGEVQEIVELRRQGLTITTIGELTGNDRKTIRKYLAQREGRPVYGPRAPRTSMLDSFKGYVEVRLKAGVWNATVLLRELRARGYTGGYTILKDWLEPQRESSRVVAVRRFETPPGKHYGESGVMLSVTSPAARARRRKAYFGRLELSITRLLKIA
jgi:transposase